jgi:hypothetical protein
VFITALLTLTKTSGANMLLFSMQMDYKNWHCKRRTDCFCWKSLTLWVPKLTKSRRKSWHLSSILYLFLLWAILSAVVLQPLWNQGRTGMINSIFMTRDWNYPQQ